MQPTLFIKPIPDVKPGELLFYLSNKHTNDTIAFRSLALSADLDTIHKWVNQPYAKTYWQMNLNKEELQKEYRAMLNDPLKHSFIGLFNNKIVCQIDCYTVAVDELKDHVEKKDGNAGFHILMLPPRELSKDLTENMLKAFIKFYFSFAGSEILYGEPDVNNKPANLAAIKAGFHFLKEITLSYKTANLYSITKQQYHEAHPII